MQSIDLTNLTPRLHVNVIDILFQHKNEILRKLSDIRGLYFIEHVAINLINPDNEIIVLSITPSVEYNLITQELWRHDLSFNPYHYSDGEMIPWGDMYLNTCHNEVKYLKEGLHGFSYGFSLIRKMNDFSLVYSFATRSNINNLQEYYLALKNELFALGDYGYKLIRNVYEKYATTYVPPTLELEGSSSRSKGHLKLVINN